MNDGGPAFPVTAENGLGHIYPGMSLREVFAAKAMQGLLSGPRGENFSVNPSECAEDAMRIADAMLAAREKQNQTVK